LSQIHQTFYKDFAEYETKRLFNKEFRQ